MGSNPIHPNLFFLKLENNKSPNIMLKYKLVYKSTQKKALFVYIQFLKKLFLRLNVCFNIISLPKVKKGLTLLKSPHVYKKAKEHFEVSYYTYAVELLLPSHLQFKLLRLFYLNKPQMVGLKIKSKS